MLRKATAADIDRCAEIYEAHLTNEANGKNWSNWRLGLYPVRATAENALAHDWLWVGEDEKGIFGTVIFNHEQMKEYAQMNWRYPAEGDEVFVIHTLCIDPARRGEGKATEMLLGAETVAREMGCTVIRLDTWEGNIPAQTLYKKLGYALTGGCDFWFANAYTNPLVCLDKKL